jgi:acetyl-CoA acetyltransferase
VSRRAAIVGVGYTELTKKSGRTVLDQATEAAQTAMRDAGVSREDVDGVSSFMILNDSVSSEALATSLALPRLRYVMDFQQGGQSPCYIVWNAAMAIEMGIADTVVVFRALNGRSGIRVGSSRFAGGASQYRYPIGYSAYLMYIAMWARRYLWETGQDEHDLAAVPVAQRWYAQRNDRAVRRKSLDLDAYFEAPYVAEPFRTVDCTTEVDGACALVMTSLERARDLPQPPVVVASGAYFADARPGLDIGDHVLHEDYTRNFTWHLRDELYARAGVGVEDVDFAEIYDCFSSTVMMSLEGLGFCDFGEAGGFIRDGNTAVDGRLPVNTNGGLLAEGYLHGMNAVAEAARQIQGRGGDRQVPRNAVGVVTSGALVDGSALVLTADD